MAEMRRLRVMSDGTTAGTEVYVGDVRVAGITKIEWVLDVTERHPVVRLEAHATAVITTAAPE